MPSRRQRAAQQKHSTARHRANDRNSERAAAVEHRLSAKQEPLRELTLAELRMLAIAAVVVLCLGAYVFSDALRYLWNVWGSDPDYSHGYLVAPLSIYFLYLRRDTFPGLRPFCWWALMLVFLGLATRVAGDLAYIDALNAWSLVIWFAGVFWFLTGSRSFRWALPAIAFLFLALPLPYRAERLLSVPLQTVATTVSTWTLQTMGEPAIAEGNKILIGENEFGVEEACSGLRIFISILAVASACLILTKRTWWERLLLLASVLPVALIANITRVVITCLFYEHASGELAQRFSHDLAGYFMIPYAALLFAFVLWYLRVLFTEVEQLDVRSVLRHG